LQTFLAERPRLRGIALRMLGDVAETEDVLQEVWLRWQAVDATAVGTPEAFLTTVTTRLAVNVATSARVRREACVGSWLAELPAPADAAIDPAVGAEQTSDLQTAVLVLFERLPPVERAAYVLREAFGYPHRRIAGVLGVSEDNARQVLHRARRRLDGRPSQPVDPADHRRMLVAFTDASRHGDLPGLERLLRQRPTQMARSF
jgi:RNA polymerase sigma-70 factor (ECF subfamily)